MQGPLCTKGCQLRVGLVCNCSLIMTLAVLLAWNAAAAWTLCSKIHISPVSHAPGTTSAHPAHELRSSGSELRRGMHSA